jgi:hypothetical protein
MVLLWPPSIVKPAEREREMEGGERGAERRGGEEMESSHPFPLRRAVYYWLSIKIQAMVEIWPCLLYCKAVR